MYIIGNSLDSNNGNNTAHQQGKKILSLSMFSVSKVMKISFPSMNKDDQIITLWLLFI